MFAFDVSSLLLYFLQSCLNSPDPRWKSPIFVTWVHRLLVVPSFIFCRFFIWPALWYSMAIDAESREWFQQLENMLWNGAARSMRMICHTLMILLMALNLLYLYRLLHHPHLRRITKSAGQTVFPG
jgi:hypothetical protein